MDDIRDIAAYYNLNPEREHGRLAINQLEFDLTMRFLKRYLPPSRRLLEVGAATGRYTLPLVEAGYDLTAVDLAPAQMQFCRAQLQEAGMASHGRFVVSDVRSIGLVKAECFDAILLMGPLYHLMTREDRQRALKAAYDRLIPGGILFTTFISRYGILGDLMKNIPDWIEQQEEVNSVLDYGHDPWNASEGFRGYFAEVREITPLHESLGFRTLALVGVEPAISADDESYNRLEGRQRQLWLNLLERISEEESMLGASRHLLYIGEKP